MLLKNHIIYSSVNVKMKCQVVLSFTAVEDGIFASTLSTVAIPKIISVKNARAWVSMISYLKK